MNSIIFSLLADHQIKHMAQGKQAVYLVTTTGHIILPIRISVGIIIKHTPGI